MKKLTICVILIFSICMSINALPCPCNNPDEVCTGGKCLKINNNVATCLGISDCADQLNGQCNAGKCECVAKSWSPLHEKCLTPNVNIGTVSSITDCMDQYLGGFDSKLNTCVCSQGTWNSLSGSCGVPLGAFCDGKNSYCFDMTNGGCSLGKCLCKGGYRGKVVDGVHVCRASNDGTMPCNSLYQCYSDNTLSVCANGKCNCQSPGLYSSYSGRCGKPNNNAYSCSTDNECLSHKEIHGDCQGTCIYTDGYLWDDDARECLAPNNSKYNCLNFRECYGFVKDAVTCKTTCQCHISKKWDSVENKCFKLNDNINPCTDISECYDKSINAGCISNKCTCKEHYIYDSISKKCLAKNDDIGKCLIINDCIVSDAKGDCDNNVCKCKNPYVWSVIQNTCAFPNDATSFATLDQCADNRAQNAKIINSKCDCNSNYYWTNANGVWLCRGGYGEACSNLEFDCASSSTLTSKCDVSCICKTDYEWNSDNHKCQAYNSGDKYCNSFEDCYDMNPTAAECSSAHVCTCKENYTWKNPGFKCAGKNNDLSSCVKVSECVDISSFSSCKNGFCSCRTSFVWSEALGKCACDLGMYLFQGKICVPCDPNFYKNEISLNACKACPIHSESLFGASLCTCNIGSYYNSSFSTYYCQDIFFYKH